MIIQNKTFAHFRLMNYLQCIFHSSIQDDAGVETSSFDDRSASVIRLNNSTVLYLKVKIQRNHNKIPTLVDKY